MAVKTTGVYKLDETIQNLIKILKIYSVRADVM